MVLDRPQFQRGKSKKKKNRQLINGARCLHDYEVNYLASHRSRWLFYLKYVAVLLFFSSLSFSHLIPFFRTIASIHLIPSILSPIHTPEQSHKSVPSIPRSLASSVVKVLAIPELLQHKVLLAPKRSLCNLGLVSRVFRAAVLASCSLQFEEIKVLPSEREKFLQENGPRIRRAEFL